MHIRVLGAAAGGGFPQWNCNCDNCHRSRAGDPHLQPRSQSSIALSANGTRWVLINASPDIRTQIDNFPALQPAAGARGTGIAAVMLMDSQIDHTTGLLILREGEPLKVYCTDMVYQDLTTGFPVLRMLEHYCGVDRVPIAIDGTAFRVDGIDDLHFTAVPLRSKAPPYSPHRHDSHPGDNIGLRVDDPRTGGTLFYAPGLGQIDDEVLQVMRKADCLLVDGTFWTDDEMIVRRVGTKRAAAMGHLAQSGPGGMLEILQDFPDTRRILIHINNTNPILDDRSPEVAELHCAGIEVAFDGMDFTV